VSLVKYPAAIEINSIFNLALNCISGNARDLIFKNSMENLRKILSLTSTAYFLNLVSMETAPSTYYTGSWIGARAGMDVM
jgi:hypothetical protein